MYYVPSYLHCIILHSAPKLEKYCRKTPSFSSLLEKIFKKSQCKLYNFSELHFSRILVHSDLYINGRYLDLRMCKCYCLNSWNDDVFVFLNSSILYEFCTYHHLYFVKLIIKEFLSLIILLYDFRICFVTCLHQELLPDAEFSPRVCGIEASGKQHHSYNQQRPSHFKTKLLIQ